MNPSAVYAVQMTAFSFYNGSGKIAKYCLARPYFLADCNFELGLGGDVKINAGAKTNQAETLAATNLIVHFQPTDNSSGNQAGHLDKGQPVSSRAPENGGAMFIVQGPAVTVC